MLHYCLAERDWFTGRRQRVGGDSIPVAFDHILSCLHLDLNGEGSTPFVARICVIDFEVKRMEKIPLWYEQQLELLQSYDERSVG